MSTTFREMQDDVLRLIALSNDRDAREYVKRRLNDRAEEVWRYYPWRERKATAFVNTVLPYSTGTVTTNGTTAIVGASTVFPAACADRKFAISYSEPYYNITTRTDGTNLVLERAFLGDDGAAQSYAIYDDVLTLTSMDSLVTNEMTLMYSGKDRPMSDLTSQGWSDSGHMPRTAAAPTSFRLIENTSTGAPQIQVWPVPDAVYAIRYRYLTEYTDMKSDGDTCVVPESRRHLIIGGATADAFKYNEEYSKFVIEERAFKGGLKDAVKAERALHPQAVTLRAFNRRSGARGQWGRIAIDWSSV